MRTLLPHYRTGSRSKAGKCAFHPGDEGGAARAAGGVDVVEREEPGPDAAAAQPGEATEDDRTDRIAQHQPDQPPRGAVGRDYGDLFDVGERGADRAAALGQVEGDALGPDP